MPAPTDGPTMISLSEEERLSGVLTPEHLFDAVTAMFRDGLVVLSNAIDVQVIDKLNDKMKDDTAKILSGAVKVHWNQGRDKGNVSQVPPIAEEWLFPEIYANKAASHVLSHVLGPKPELRYIRSNTLLGNATERQRVHKDVKMRHLMHPFAIAMNVCLIDASPENGSTEVWLGTSSQSTSDDLQEIGLGFVREDKLEERRAVRPPVQASIPRGSLILRDLRLWHAGMPNNTPETRVMLAFVYFAAWYGCEMQQPVPRSLKPAIEALAASNDSKIVVEYVDDELASDYLNVEFEAKFWSKLQQGAM
ncbi:hypothetical protein B9479_000345 [Cryptococcus floricola]|uniref:Phytanoyl-CoA dioxygenase n=1 Tax=Cryptococcus floricola TaxID=2591691 RepID=A0A5D3B7J7_9TREE|nr:hypothetical protein B9479_000345 [Cryptococcus floricola]